MAKTNTIVRIHTFENRTPTGRKSVTGVRKLTQYLAFGRGRPSDQAAHPQRGIWHTETGKPVPHNAVMAWVQDSGRTSLFTHQLLLSVKDIQLTPEAYAQAMLAGGDLFPSWRLISHQDTNHSHSHVLTFGEREVRVKDQDFHRWWTAVHQALDELRQQALSTHERQQAYGLDAATSSFEPTANPSLQQGWEM